MCSDIDSTREGGRCAQDENDSLAVGFFDGVPLGEAEARVVERDALRDGELQEGVQPEVALAQQVQQMCTALIQNRIVRSSGHVRSATQQVEAACNHSSIVGTFLLGGAKHDAVLMRAPQLIAQSTQQRGVWRWSVFSFRGELRCCEELECGRAHASHTSAAGVVQRHSDLGSRSADHTRRNLLQHGITLVQLHGTEIGL